MKFLGWTLNGVDYPPDSPPQWFVDEMCDLMYQMWKEKHGLDEEEQANASASSGVCGQR